MVNALLLMLYNNYFRYEDDRCPFISYTLLASELREAQPYSIQGSYTNVAWNQASLSVSCKVHKQIMY